MTSDGDSQASRVDGGESTLSFEPILSGYDTISIKRKIASFSPYKIALFTVDIVSAVGGFWLGLWLTGWAPVVRQDLNAAIGFVIVSLTVIAFFPAHHLYSYHIIFSGKKHLINLVKSFCWSVLTLGIILFLFNSFVLLTGNYVVFITCLSAVAVAFLFLGRFLWSHLLDFLMSIGMAFLIFGMTGLAWHHGIPAFMADSLAFAFYFFLTAVMLLAGRGFLVHVVYNRWLRRYFRRQMVIAGSDREAQKIANYILDHNAPFWIVGTVGREADSGLECSMRKGCLGELEKLPKIVREFKIDDIIITDENIAKQTLVSLLDFCTSAGIDAWFPPKLMPIIDIKLNSDNFCGLPMIRLCVQKNTWWFNKIKHGLDALITLPLFIISLPLFLAIAVAIKIDSRGPVFYRARAVGKNGRIFSMYKFRSMTDNSSHEVHKNYVTRLIKGEIGKEDATDQPLKITEDPRVTRVGKVLRKFSLDELPQLINVIKGDMSLIGPRPCLPYECELYKDWYKKRFSVRAGITGLWQVAGRSEVSFEDMILLDLYYIYNRSLAMDFNILFETIFVVLQKRGAF